MVSNGVAIVDGIDRNRHRRLALVIFHMSVNLDCPTIGH
jgi:hypothetical protein